MRSGLQGRATMPGTIKRSELHRTGGSYNLHVPSVCRLRAYAGPPGLACSLVYYYWAGWGFRKWCSHHLRPTDHLCFPPRWHLSSP